jgi:TPR repeat protein
MRAIVSILILVSTQVSFGGVGMRLIRPGASPRPDPWAEIRQRRQLQEAQEAWSSIQTQHRQEQITAWQSYVPEDPYRIIDGATVFAKGPDWLKFGGKIVEVLPDGIRVQGSCKSLNDPFQFYTYRGEFFVAHFPYTNSLQILVEERFCNFTAKEAGAYALTESNSIPGLEYGSIAIPPPPSLEEADAVARNAEAAVLRGVTANEQAMKSLKWNQEQAAKGDPYGLLRMGERYLSGDGVEKDLVKATDYLSRAAAQGSVKAADILKKLSP